MTTEKNSEKLALYVALIASILAVVLSAYTYLVPPSGGGFQSAPSREPARRPPGGGAGGAGGGGGGMMRGFTPSPEYIQKYEARVDLLRQALAGVEAEQKAGVAVLDDVYDQLYLFDEARLNLLRLKAGRRAASSFADAYLAAKISQVYVREMENQYKNGMIQLKVLNEAKLDANSAELRLFESELRLNKEKLEEAKASVKEYPAKLTDAQLEKLLAAEQRTRGSR